MISEAAEAVQFARDEQANLAWALELTVTGQDGMPLDRHSQAAASPDGGGVVVRGPRPASPSGSLRYVLASTVPEYWFPLVADAAGHFDPAAVAASRRCRPAGGGLAGRSAAGRVLGVHAVAGGGSPRGHRGCPGTPAGP